MIKHLPEPLLYADVSGAGFRVLIAGRRPIAFLPLIAAIAISGAAGCGASSKPKAPQTQSTSASQTSKATSSNGGASVSTGAIRATLHGADRAPTAGKVWAYLVRVTDAAGQPLSGTVDTEFTFAGQVVGRETPPTHPLKGGLLTDTVTFPKESIGEPLALQTVVHTSRGSVTLSWPVTVRP